MRGPGRACHWHRDGSVPVPAGRAGTEVQVGHSLTVRLSGRGGGWQAGSHVPLGQLVATARDPGAAGPGRGGPGPAVVQITESLGLGPA